ncbi:hypothetical protein [Aeromicrobium marinum]|nr:hypothetical protein [Aeromicrobium marinum]
MTATAGWAIGGAPAASAADIDEAFSGTARNYGVFAAVGLLNNSINARANIAEGVVVVNSKGLSAYDGTGVGQFAVPSTVANDPTARAYGRAAPVGVGAVGLNLQLVKAESVSTTVVDGVLDVQDFGTLNIPVLGNLSVLTGSADTNWNDTVLTAGGRLGYAESNTGALTLLDPTLGIPLPVGIFPLGEADLGQNTSEVSLVPDSAACSTGLAVQSQVSWDFADIALFNGLVNVSWGGDAGNPNDSALLTATANGMPAGADLVVSELPDMTIRIGDASVELQPGLAIELDQVFNGSPVGNALSGLIDGEITYTGTTNVVEAANGTVAGGSLNGLQADLTLAPIPIVAPAGLGAAELGFERADAQVQAPLGGINCSDSGTDQTGVDQTGVDQTGVDQTGVDQTGVDQTGTDQSGSAQNGATQAGANQFGASGSGSSGGSHLPATGGSPVSLLMWGLGLLALGLATLGSSVIRTSRTRG